MKRTMKRFLLVMLGFMLALAFYCGAAAAQTSGTWGQLTWTLDDDGLLTISGAGDMADYTNTEAAPWDSDRESIMTVIVRIVRKIEKMKG